MGRLRITGPGRYTGVDDNGVRYSVGESGPGRLTGMDEHGKRVVIRMTGPGRLTLSRPEQEKRPEPKRKRSSR